MAPLAVHNRARDRRGALQVKAAVTEPNAGVLERIDQAAQRPILRPWHGVGLAFPSAQAIAMDPGAGS
jgi:hypothetical protein